METIAKRNGAVKKETTKVNTQVSKTLAKKAAGGNTEEKVVKAVTVQHVNLDERMQRFEKLRGLANQREKLNNTLIELARFNYNQDGSSAFFIKDASGLEFKTTNSNLITMVSGKLQETLETRKTEIEKELMEFQL